MGYLILQDNKCIWPDISSTKKEREMRWYEILHISWTPVKTNNIWEVAQSFLLEDLETNLKVYAHVYWQLRGDSALFTI